MDEGRRGRRGTAEGLGQLAGEGHAGTPRPEVRAERLDAHEGLHGTTNHSLVSTLPPVEQPPFILIYDFRLHVFIILVFIIVGIIIIIFIIINFPSA